MAQKQHQQQCAQRQLSLWGELPDSILHRVLLVAAPRNHTSVNLVNKRWKAQHEVVVRNLSPPVWDAAWLGTRFPRLVSLMLDDQTTVRRPPVSQATALLPGPATPAAQHPHHYHQQQQREEEEGRVIVSDMDLIGLSTLSSLQALALKWSPPHPYLIMHYPFKHYPLARTRFPMLELPSHRVLLSTSVADTLTSPCHIQEQLFSFTNNIAPQTCTAKRQSPERTAAQ
eukprot:CAMPEP_0177793634 /NCGR_PEP_ID=MMETSP0491_2-20121128/25189_1 /TAXON_ID=63592 /ORGANISM="Tetraselmis chuii, Strain PLY429" /LENGTH=227 /DNA_ID=CAMNT_0019316181 /DNA_START=83 /DNA_END=766 /DNA_ORIENTATION=-